MDAEERFFSSSEALAGINGSAYSEGLQQARHQQHLLFETFPIPLFEIDISSFGDLFDRFRSRGIADLHRHLLNQRSDLMEFLRSMRIVFANQATLTFLEATDIDELNEHFGELFLEDTLKDYARNIAEIAQGSNMIRSENSCRTLRGRSVDLIMNGHVLYDSNWKPQILTISVIDISERKKAERSAIDSQRQLDERVKQRTAELSAANEKLREEIDRRKQIEKQLLQEKRTVEQIIQLNPYSISVFDQEGRFVAGNDASRRLFGGTPKEDYSLFNDPLLAKLGIEEHFENLCNGIPISLDRLWYNASEIYPEIPDHPIYIRINAFPIRDADGSIRHFVLMHLDETQNVLAAEEMSRQEEFLRTLVDNLPFEFWAMDRYGHFTMQNASCREKWGELTGRQLEDLPLTQYAREHWRKQNARALNGYEVREEILFSEGEIEGALYNAISPIRHGENIHGILGVTIDISDRKAAERRLKQSESHLRAIFAAAENVGFVTTQLIGDEIHIQDFSPGAERIFGYSDREISGLPLTTLFAPESVEQCDELQMLCRDSEQGIAREVVMQRNDGERFFAHCNVYPLFGLEDRTINSLHVIIDISNLKKTQQDLINRVRLENLVSSISTRFINLPMKRLEEGIEQALKDVVEFLQIDRACVFLFDDELTRTRKAHEWHAQGIEPLPERFDDASTEGFSWWNKRLESLQTTVLHDVRDLPPEARGERSLVEDLKIGSVVHVPMFHGEKLLGLLTAMTVRRKKHWSDESVSLIRMVGEIFARAIEHKRILTLISESEQEYRTLFEQSRDAIYITDESNRIFDVNQAAVDLLGYDHDEMIGLVLTSAFIDADDRKTFQKNMRRHDGLKDFETRIRKKDGQIIDCLITAWPRLSAQGELLRYQGIIRDVTESKKIERRRREYEQSQRDFVANVSHELKTPLTAIRGFSETLLGGALSDPETVAHFVRIIFDQSARLGHLTEDLLRISQLDSGKLVLDLQEVSLIDTIESCIEAVRLKTSRNELHIETDIPAKFSVLQADPRRLREIFQNLIDNAVHYTPSGGKVLVRARGVGKNQLKIQVQDTGIGIPTEAIPRIFERFFRVDTARSREIGGTGLGLSIVKHLVELHDGTIDVQSEPTRGTTFTIRLPIRRKR